MTALGAAQTVPPRPCRAVDAATNGARDAVNNLGCAEPQSDQVVLRQIENVHVCHSLRPFSSGQVSLRR